MLLLLSVNLFLRSCTSSSESKDKDRADYPPILDDAVTLGRSIYVYVPPQEFRVVKTGSVEYPHYVGKRINAADSKVLMPLDDWLYSHDEYQAEPDYIVNRLHQDGRLYTNDLSEAHLCYPSCTYCK
jgi:hypothetical protein